ncbi:MAG: 2-oxoglutarate dehydrogenase complex dihydrolipoyllysine-residue succinyltransferase [Firmicutes bacterium]|jgi:2-oxoglutarate dehydrogenase E2 component (dihydrolipoamide succinyltransferase)|nr:2-oxoglutarate dehydrogenase complex dihydrolipoyllysine-residue succinyltransferase [Bacillota bacterium]MCL5066417.1 2-oxoglutarate dehydrogenase complex dihydrolipoyllysine-residue succinyltransferase [Bacillota bacterium]
MSIEISVPALGESIVEATVGQWLKQPGDTVSLGDALVELETDKVNLEVSATASGTLKEISCQEGETVSVGQVLGMLEAGDDSAGATPIGEPLPAAPTPDPSPESAAGDRRASPGVRNVAEQLAVDLQTVVGSGPRGRVIRADVERSAEQHPQKPEAAPAPSPAVEERPNERRVRLSQRRLTIARRLVEAQHTAAMLTTFNEVDMSVVQELRHRWRDRFKERYGVSLGLMSFFTKATVAALKAFPQVNAEIQGTDMVLKDYYDIGIAVGTDQGLVVPVVRGADRLSFAQIEQAIRSVATKAREKTLSLEDLRGGTFTITNGGTYGSLLSTPILNTPQVGILGLHKIEERPVAVEGQVLIRPMMYVALTYDHRLIDGGDAVRFLVKLKNLMEDPESLLLEG